MESRWRRATSGAVFHSKEFFARKRGRRVGEYAQWSDADAETHIKRLCDAVCGTNLTIIGAAIDIPAFMAYDEDTRRYLTGAPFQADYGVWRDTGAPSKPYFLGFSTCITAAINRRTRPDLKVHYWFDRQDDYEGKARQIIAIATGPIASPTVREAVGALVYEDKAKYEGLQAADLVAYVRCAIEQDNYKTTNKDLFIAAQRLQALPKKRQMFLVLNADVLAEKVARIPEPIRAAWRGAKGHRH
jgi:hypothetical protein